MTKDDGRISIAFADKVTVRRGEDFETARVASQHGVLFGDFYVTVNIGYDAQLDPETNFDVGHEPSGLKVIGGLTFWEARRVAMAMDDADLRIPVTEEDFDDPDLVYIVHAVIASALQDHYVFPLGKIPRDGGRYPIATPGVPDALTWTVVLYGHDDDDRATR